MSSFKLKSCGIQKKYFLFEHKKLLDGLALPLCFAVMFLVVKKSVFVKCKEI